MIDYQEHITALRVLIVSGAVRGRTVEYSGDKALAMTDHLNAIETALAAAEANAATLRAEVERLRGALQWCSGSDDFQEGGKAREGWLKLCAPLLHGEGKHE